MSLHYKIYDNQGKVIINKLPDKYSYLIESTIESPSSKKDVLFGSNVRYVKINDGRYTFFALTTKAQYIKSSRKFNTEVQLILDCIDDAIKFRYDFIKDTQDNTNRLIHNLVTLNAHNMQEVYSIIPQEVLADKRNKQWKMIITEYVKEDLSEAALSLVRIAKNSLKMKTEVSVYNSLRNGKVSLEKKNHHIHRVLMNLFYVFFPDFTDKEVLVDVERTNLQSVFDYETVTVALYYILDNAVKYIKPNSELKVSIDKEKFSSKIMITFEMISIKVDESELEKIFEEGVSGLHAVSCGKAGQGIGMSRARELLKLNDIDIHFEPVKGTDLNQLQYCYQRNLVKVIL
ncbi:ATP-binding protein [Vibrio cholerae]|uniref:ATP-binding protein n=1 Tax=Vibrio cholerae TaxID=666 RepID=UPI001E5A2773|nr:ATP-binding protein [Vibrio cholerae]EJL7008121.1 sensor histidine kinase [Vibrio cholerae]EKF9698041.1 sensor histidine kinase [Vibrio cholerae]MCD1219854.1 ATP-binding protein [Vibrio cholerae]